MKKLLRPKDVLLLGLAGAIDIFEVARDPFGIAAEGCQMLYGWVPEKYKRHNFGRLVERGLKTGEIEKIIKNDKIYLRLTSAGEDKLIRDFPLISLQNRRWDGKWRIVVFDIEEISRRTRDILRDKLKELGFGMLQRSVWISPHDIAIDIDEFLKSHGLSEYVFVMEVSSLLSGDQKDLADRIWKIGILNKAYKAILEELNELKHSYITSHDREFKGTGKKINSLKNLKDKMRELREKYIALLIIDPHLPFELLPDDWAGNKLKTELSKIIL